MCLADLGTVFEELIQDRFLLVILDAHTFALDCTTLGSKLKKYDGQASFEIVS